ncbi:MAG: hypothetical protein WAL30_04040 [Candidatus Aquirickettsiella sp.]
MPNNQTNYRIKLEFVSFLRDLLPGLTITDCESEHFVNVAINQIPYQNSLAHFSSFCSRLPPYSLHYIIDELFQELQKELVDRDKLDCIKRYLWVLKQIEISCMYHIMTPGMVAGLFIVLHLCLLFFPANKILIYSSLVVDLYGLGFWFFSVWSFSRYTQDLREIENKLINKIDFLKSPPSYEAVLSQNVTETESTLNVSNFFCLHESNGSSDSHDTGPVPRLK